MIRRCAEPTCGYLVRWQTRCPLHRPPDQRGRRDEGSAGRDRPAGGVVTLEWATTAAAELLRVSLLAKLAVDLEDPVLARRAARKAQAPARLLAGLDFAAYVGEDQDDDALPEVGDLLEQLHPNRTEHAT